MYQYIICGVPDEDLFKKQCTALEKHISDIERLELLHDVDNSLTQRYQLNGASISVHNSPYIRGLYVESEVELEQFFK